jgi:hypothetical protein
MGRRGSPYDNAKAESFGAVSKPAFAIPATAFPPDAFSPTDLKGLITHC